MHADKGIKGLILHFRTTETEVIMVLPYLCSALKILTILCSLAIKKVLSVCKKVLATND